MSVGAFCFCTFVRHHDGKRRGFGGCEQRWDGGGEGDTATGRQPTPAGASTTQRSARQSTLGASDGQSTGQIGGKEDLMNRACPHGRRCRWKFRQCARSEVDARCPLHCGAEGRRGSHNSASRCWKDVRGSSTSLTLGRSDLSFIDMKDKYGNTPLFLACIRRTNR